MSTNSISSNNRSPRRFIRFVIFFFITFIIFMGGLTALLYLVFSKYTGIQNIWLLICGAPFAIFVLLLFTVINLYTRFGKPLEQLFNAINAVGEGDLTIRVSEDRSDMFSDLVKRFNKMVADLERAEQQRRNLTADIAHELRTPLHIIQGNLEGISDGIYDPTPAHIKDTLDETKLLARLVDDLQTLSLAESGNLPLHPTRFRLADLITDISASFNSPAASQGISLQTNIANKEQFITADYDRLNQVFSNLISNAIHHTPEGGYISIETGKGSDVEGSIWIKVKDSGSGIKTENLPYIFDRFWRADKSRSERNHSGLGLAITRQLILAHHGKIQVESSGKPGEGTAFTIELPTSIDS